MTEQADALGIDPLRILVAGDSAGGNLAAVVALLARDGQVPAVIGQVLIYPVTDQLQASDSYLRYAEGYGLTAAAMQWFRDHYLPEAASRPDWRASPLRVASLAGVAPALVILAGYDVLFDEAAAYAERLSLEAQATSRTGPDRSMASYRSDGPFRRRKRPLKPLLWPGAPWTPACPLKRNRD